ncbi:heme peroxidase [Tilletia horrida]|uniref:Peroxidase n=1 Tax=Tilletia horrida TaxID=155126 RepID=A0AAN6GMF9_9BASI|nr:heme peroxidase [Tilletia horrida]KAK0532246.1 heme peroxidase [Tilletia horrida]KAK0541225.1 heme peroxidase [Tilletia horrida]KAK0561393.1 heme peroxidase [Tilletia horrida]
MAAVASFRSTLRAAGAGARVACANSAAPSSSSSFAAARTAPRLPSSASPRVSIRTYANAPAPGGNPPPHHGSSTSTTKVLFASVGVILAAGTYFYLSDTKNVLGVGYGEGEANKIHGAKARVTARVLSGPATQKDYQEVYNAIAEKLEKDPEYDGGQGHYGPVLVRLAWHASGTYDKNTNSGGSNGATMRFAPESDHGANAGLLVARKYMDEVHEQFPWITYSDLWTLGGVAAIQEMGGPTIPWRPGRQDLLAENCTPDGRLPDGDKGPDHIRHIFYRMGFNDQEIVALSGAHALGRCHPDRSGFEGPWTFSPTSFTNAYFQLLFDSKWQLRKWDGPIQYQDKETSSLMMLTTDMALVQDKKFRKFAELYAKSEDKFFEDFSKAFGKLLELGVPEQNFKAAEAGEENGRKWAFKTLADQDSK